MSVAALEAPGWVERAIRERCRIAGFLRAEGIDAEDPDEAEVRRALGHWRNPGRHVRAEVMPDEWFDNALCNRTLDRETAKALVDADCRGMGAGDELRLAMLRQVGEAGTGRPHEWIDGVIQGHMSGYGRRPKAEEIAAALHRGAESRDDRWLVGALGGEIDAYNDTPCAMIAVCVEEKLSLRALARALRNAGVTTPQVVDWLNGQGGPATAPPIERAETESEDMP